MQDKEPKIQKIKICYVVTKGNWGGAQKYVYNLATSLPKDIYDVVAIVGEGNILKNKLEEKGILVYELTDLKKNISLVREYKSSLAMLKIIHKEKPNALHLSSPKAAGFGSVAGRLTGVSKIIQTVHGFTFNEDRGILNNTLVFLFSWLTILLCHKTIVLSQQEERQALAIPLIKKNKIVLIRNGIENINFKERNIARKELIGLLRDSKLETRDSILWLGTISELHKNKGLKYAIEAVSKITSPFVFFILGEGEEKNNLENLIKKYNLGDKVFLVGFINNATEYLKAFDIFILTSIKEGLPYAILEAGLAGLSVIASSVGGIPDMIENSVSGILTTKTRSGEITRAIEYLISNSDKQKLFAENLRQKVLKDFSMEQMLEKTTRLYS